MSRSQRTGWSAGLGWGAALLAAVLMAARNVPAAAADTGATAVPPAMAAAKPLHAAVAVNAIEAPDPQARRLNAGRFGTVNVYLPEGTPRSVALFVSGDGGWELGIRSMAHALRDLGAVVIGIDVRRYLASLHETAQRPGAPCQMIAGDFETLSHQLQKQLALTDYHVPVLVGYSSGATVVYATLVQSPPGTFAGALSLGFCPDQDFAGAALCPGNGLRYTPNAQHELVFSPATTLKQPWIALQGQKDQVCSPQVADRFAAQVAGATIIRLPLVGHGFSVERNWMPQFREAYARLTARAESPPERAPQIGDLPLQEVPASATGNDAAASEFALLLTGDGGWAGLDQELAARLAANGVPTVGLNSLKYFWTARTPEQTARDVTRVLRHYLAAWHKERVLLIGYSFGADVLPFVFNRLPPELRVRVASVSLLGIDAHASFEVHVTEWVSGDEDGPATRPEVLQLAHVPVLCIYGEGESDSICPGLASAGIAREQVGRGHHFSGEYATLAERILAYARGGHPVT